MKPASSEQSSNSVVLVIDDDPNVRGEIQTLLHSVTEQGLCFCTGILWQQAIGSDEWMAGILGLPHAKEELAA
jgi:hypothetical protein